MNHDLFISYARRDQTLVIPYLESLRERGISIWIDQSGIDGATLWSAEIVEAIKQSKVVMVMCSSASLTSPHVAREIFLATEESKPLLPVYLEPVDVPSSVRYHLVGIQHVEVFQNDFEKNIHNILRALNRLAILNDVTSVRFNTPLQPAAVHKTRQEFCKTGILKEFFQTIVAGYSTLSREARLSLFFAIMGGPAWFMLIAASTIGIALDPRMIWGLAFLFLLGMIFNALGIVTAILGLKCSTDSQAILVIGLIFNIGEALGIIALLVFAAPYIHPSF